MSQHGQLYAIPLALACALEVRYPPCKRGISAIPARYHMKTKLNACDAPSAILSRKGIARFVGHLKHDFPVPGKSGRFARNRFSDCVFTSDSCPLVRDLEANLQGDLYAACKVTCKLYLKGGKHCTQASFT